MNKPDTPLQRKLDAETREAKVEVLAALERLHDKLNTSVKSFGICACVTAITDLRPGVADSILAALFAKWPESSGDSEYPVPSFQTGVTPAAAYNSADDMWDPDTVYGQARIRLLEFSIQELRTELEGVAA